MMKRTALFASLIGIVGTLVAAQAQAEVTLTTAVSVDGPRPITALEMGDVVTIDVTLRSDGEATFAIAASAHLYDPAVAVFQSGTAVNGVLNPACTAGGCFGGVNNELVNTAGQLTGPVTEDLTSNPLGPEIQFMNGVSTSGSVLTGEADFGIDAVAGTAQFQLVFVAGSDGTTTIEIGGNQDFGDGIIIGGGAVGVLNNSDVVLTVPEPGVLASSALALASVFGVVGLRRRS